MNISVLRSALAAIVLMSSAVASVAYDRHLSIHNDTGMTLYQFYSTNSGASRWGHDVMGNSTLPNGAAMTLNFDNSHDYCEFDFRAVFEDGTVLQRSNVNVCETGDYYYTQ